MILKQNTSKYNLHLNIFWTFGHASSCRTRALLRAARDWSHHTTQRAVAHHRTKLGLLLFCFFFTLVTCVSDCDQGVTSKLMLYIIYVLMGNHEKWIWFDLLEIVYWGFSKMELKVGMKRKFLHPCSFHNYRNMIYDNFRKILFSYPYSPWHPQIKSENHASNKGKQQGVPNWLKLKGNKVKCPIAISI